MTLDLPLHSPELKPKPGNVYRDSSTSHCRIPETCRLNANVQMHFSFFFFSLYVHLWDEVLLVLPITVHVLTIAFHYPCYWYHQYHAFYQSVKETHTK